MPVLYDYAMTTKTLIVDSSNDDTICLSFESVCIQYEEGIENNIFAKKNNKSLADTLNHRRYSKLKVDILSSYPMYLNMPLGQFLLERKISGDNVYKKFLNRYGDLSYSKFFITDPQFMSKKGIYAYYAENELKYIGRCRDSIKKRINQGYGKIHPKNCYLDGQATNCRINALITKARQAITFWFCQLEFDEDIEQLERELISKHSPLWNIQK